MSPFNELDFETPFYPLYGDTITVPANTVFWRGYNPLYSSVSGRPAYFGAKHTALGYAKQAGHTLGLFTTTRPLRVLDIRFMKVILSQLLENVPPTVKNDDRHVVLSMTISFGLCSLAHQIKLLKHLYKDNLDSLPGVAVLEQMLNAKAIIEQPGVRIAETTTDGFILVFLKELFKGFVDGFISPRLESAFHIEKRGSMSPELILFDPLGAGIQMLREMPRQGLQPITIQSLIRHPIVSVQASEFKTEFYMKGGARIHIPHPLDTFNTLMDMGDRSASDLYRIGSRCGKRWKGKFSDCLIYMEPPGPTVPVVFPPPSNPFKPLEF